MSNKAVADLLAEWESGSNPLFRSAAGQMRKAMRAKDEPRVCHLCGRGGTSRFVAAPDGDRCWNVEACARRAAAL